MTDNKLFVSWIDYYKMCERLCNQVKDEGFTDIVALARGGLIPAQILAHNLNIRHIQSLGVSLYSKNKKKATLNFYQPITNKFTPKSKILVVDDIADSGETLLKCLPFINNGKQIEIAVLFYKSEKSVVRPKYFAHSIPSHFWVVFPYEKS